MQSRAPRHSSYVVGQQAALKSESPCLSGDCRTAIQIAAIKIGSALPSPMTSSMRNFGASRDKRRPDVRFCGVEAAGEDGLGLTKGYQRSGLHAGPTTSA